QYNPDIRTVLIRLAEQAADVFDKLEVKARNALREFELPRAGPMVILDRMRLAGLPRNLIREALRQLWQREGWPRDRMRYEDWDQVAAVARGELAAVDLPGRLRVRGTAHVVQIRRVESAP